MALQFYLVKNPSAADIASAIAEVDVQYVDEDGVVQTKKAPVIRGTYTASNSDKYTVLARESAYSNGTAITEAVAWLFVGCSEIASGALNAGSGITDLDVDRYTSRYAKNVKARFNKRHPNMTAADKVAIVIILANPYMMFESGELGAGRKMISDTAISGAFTQAIKDDLLQDCDVVCNIFPWLKEV